MVALTTTPRTLHRATLEAVRDTLTSTLAEADDRAGVLLAAYYADDEGWQAYQAAQELVAGLELAVELVRAMVDEEAS